MPFLRLEPALHFIEQLKALIVEFFKYGVWALWLNEALNVGIDDNDLAIGLNRVGTLIKESLKEIV